MSASGDRLVAIPGIEWKNLRDLFQPKWPANAVAYYTIDNYINWLQLKPAMKNIQVYSLNGDWRDGTYLIVDRYQVFCYTLEQSCERLKRGLALLDWSKGLLISMFMKKHFDAVMSIKRKLQIEEDHLDSTFLYFCSREDAQKVQVQIPEGITLKPLSEDDVAQINESWKYKHSGSVFLIKRAIQMRESVGAYNESNELIAWCLRNQAGELAFLQVVESSHRKGLATLITKYMTRMIGDTDSDVYACIVDDNMPSVNLFKKCGFKEIDETYWVFTNPTDRNTKFEWKDD